MRTQTHPMLTNLALRRPLAVLDLETTGVNAQTDRVVEISILTLRPNGDAEHYTRRVNPGVPIPPEATAVHGITDPDTLSMAAKVCGQVSYRQKGAEGRDYYARALMD